MIPLDVVSGGFDMVCNGRRVVIFNEGLEALGKTDYHCKIKETLLIQELKPAFNVNISSEKLIFY